MVRTQSPILLFCLLLFGALSQQLIAQTTDPLTLARQVADKVIRDTRFALQPVPQKPVLDMQVIDFSSLSPRNHEMVYARTTATVDTDTTITFAITSAGAVTIWLDQQQVFTQESRPVNTPVEYAYNRFQFNNTFSCSLKKGAHIFLVQYAAGNAPPVIFLRPVLPVGDLNTAVRFSSPLPAATTVSPWLLSGPLPIGTARPLPGSVINSYYETAGKQYTWQTPSQASLSELVIDKKITYQRDAYADWNYSNGITLWSILVLGDATGDPVYAAHFNNYFRFLLQHKNYFQWQYTSLHAWRGSYHRLFRLTMLDDAGAPGLPFAEAYAKEQTPALQNLLAPITDYVSKGQMRLKDGTFCRPEPVDSTVWADDLFMSVPFLLRMAKATGHQQYLEDAAAQVVLFRKYLWDPSIDLYKHGYFHTTQQQSVAHWGRANGWIAWATAELLNVLPPKHPLYKKILQGFREHAATLVKYQGANGAWHQLPTRPDSYEETSSTAMFTLVLARGIRKGWLPASYKKNALLGWVAVAKNIDPDGTVHGICRGTEIGFTEKFYLDRPTIDHDPRGLGAVITAGIEIAQLK